MALTETIRSIIRRCGSVMMLFDELLKSFSKRAGTDAKEHTRRLYNNLLPEVKELWLSYFTPRQQDMLWRYCQGEVLAEMAARHKLSPDRVRQIVFQCVRMTRHPARRHALIWLESLHIAAKIPQTQEAKDYLQQLKEADL